MAGLKKSELYITMIKSVRMICLEQSREEGRKSREIEVAKNLLKAGVSINIIAESTGLPKAEIAQLKKHLAEQTLMF